MKKVLAILLVVVIIAAGIFLLMKLGIFPFSFGKGQGSENSGSGTVESASIDEISSEVTIEESADTIVEEKVYVDVTISENSYIYQNNTIELDALLTELSKLDSDVIVRITDERASLRAYEDLTEALDKKDINHEDSKE